jgi:glutathionyl-hydroquinone reductase
MLTSKSGTAAPARILIYRALKTLDSVIAVALPGLNQNGWGGNAIGGYPDCVPDEINGFHHLYEYYVASNPTYTGKVTVPTLRDRGHPWGGRGHHNGSSGEANMLMDFMQKACWMD